MTSPTPLLHLSAVSTGYRQRRTERVVSRDLTLTLPAGQLVMLMGPNGSGKSTLLHTIAGLLPALSGQIHIAGRRLRALRPEETARLISLVLTGRTPSDAMTVVELVRLGRHPYTGLLGGLSPEDHRQVALALEQCHLTDMSTRRVSELSDGERQRVMIARALAQQTPLIILDEPTAHLDLPSRLEVTDMLRTLAHELGKAILVSTHELDLALSSADLIWLMERGGQLTAAEPMDIVRQGHLARAFGDAPQRSYRALAELFAAREP